MSQSHKITNHSYYWYGKVWKKAKIRQVEKNKSLAYFGENCVLKREYKTQVDIYIYEYTKFVPVPWTVCPIPLILTKKTI